MFEMDIRGYGRIEQPYMFITAKEPDRMDKFGHDIHLLKHDGIVYATTGNHMYGNDIIGSLWGAYIHVYLGQGDDAEAAIEDAKRNTWLHGHVICEDRRKHVYNFYDKDGMRMGHLRPWDIPDFADAWYHEFEWDNRPLQFFSMSLLDFDEPASQGSWGRRPEDLWWHVMNFPKWVNLNNVQKFEGNGYYKYPELSESGYEKLYGKYWKDLF